MASPGTREICRGSNSPPTEPGHWVSSIVRWRMDTLLGGWLRSLPSLQRVRFKRGFASPITRGTCGRVSHHIRARGARHIAREPLHGPSASVHTWRGRTSLTNEVSHARGRHADRSNSAAQIRAALFPRAAAPPAPDCNGARLSSPCSASRFRRPGSVSARAARLPRQSVRRRIRRLRRLHPRRHRSNAGTGGCFSASSNSTGIRTRRAACRGSIPGRSTT